MQDQSGFISQVFAQVADATPCNIARLRQAAASKLIQAACRNVTKHARKVSLTVPAQIAQDKGQAFCKLSTSTQVCARKQAAAVGQQANEEISGQLDGDSWAGGGFAGAEAAILLDGEREYGTISSAQQDSRAGMACQPFSCPGILA